MPTQSIAVVLDLIALQPGQGNHHQLRAGIGLQRCKPGRQGSLSLRGQETAFIDDTPAQRREGRIGEGLGRREDREQQAEQQSENSQRSARETHCAGAAVGVVAVGPTLKLTVGAVCAPGAATNNCMGSEPECSVLAQITLGKVRRVVL